MHEAHLEAFDTFEQSICAASLISSMHRTVGESWPKADGQPDPRHFAVRLTRDLALTVYGIRRALRIPGADWSCWLVDEHFESRATPVAIFGGYQFHCLTKEAFSSTRVADLVGSADLIRVGKQPFSLIYGNWTEGLETLHPLEEFD